MRDWKGIARSSGIDIPAAGLERIADSLEALEKVTAPLFKELASEQEPATQLLWEEDVR